MLKREMPRLNKKGLVATAAIGGCCLLLLTAAAPAYEILGTGTESLIGNDLTDLGDDGDPEFDDGYDAIFDANDEPGFGGGEFAFNVFDNRLGPSNDKWCCGVGGGISEDNPMWVSAQLPTPHFLTGFTVSSANDVPERDPIHWSIQGSNDGQNYTDIYTYDDDIAPWDDRLQVIAFTEGEDFPVQTTSYDFFRMATFNTLSNPNGAYFQIGEIEYFGRADGVIPPIYVGGQGTIGERTFEGDVSNKVFGPEMPNVPGWSVYLASDTGVTIDNHTIAEDVLDEFIASGDAVRGDYAVVDLAGGGGTFPENLPYPNDVNNDSMSDFAVRAIADVVIPVGTWTIGFGSDDGGQLTIPGVEFLDSQNNDFFEDDQIRFEGNRGHGWTVGSFEVDGQPLEVTITASFHERGGGDSFEIAVLEGDVIEDANPATGWELLGDDTFGWSVKHTGIPLVSADLSAGVSSTRAWQFDVNGDTDAADQFVLVNPDPEVFTSILNIDGITIEINGTGALANGDAFTIIDADQIVGTPIITSVVPGQNWVFDADSGLICLGSCPGGVGGGDYNGDGVVNVEDIDAQAVAMKTPTQNLGVFDENGDGTVDTVDRLVWIKTHALGGNGTWVGDADLNGEFTTDDLVAVFVAGKYETPEAAGWAEGDWDGDMLFDSSDFVAAFGDGGFELGPVPGVAAVPEPSSLVLALLSVFGLVGVNRRRSR